MENTQKTTEKEWTQIMATYGMIQKKGFIIRQTTQVETSMDADIVTSQF